MNYSEFKKYIKDLAEEIRCIDSIPKELSFEEKTITLIARQQLYLALTHLLENADKERSEVKPKEDKLYYLP